MVDGSATNCPIAGFAGGGGGGSGGCATTGGGGAGGATTFFLHPVAAKNNINPRSIMLIFLMFVILFIMNLALYRTFKCTPSRILISTPAEDSCLAW
jgi:hypothetical protein